MSKSKKRNQALNLLKCIGCIAVVFIHITFPGTFGLIISRIAGFAVLMFFMIAGFYAFGNSEKVIKRKLFKIVKILLIALLVYLLYSLSIQLINHNIVNWLKDMFSPKRLAEFFTFCSLDYARHLWYLIAMAETYLIWFLIVKIKSESKIVKCMLLFFVFSYVISTLYKLSIVDWQYNYIFIISAVPWFLLGYYIRMNEDKIKAKKNDFLLMILSAVGLAILIIAVFLKTKVYIDLFGIILLIVPLFILAVRYPNIKIPRLIAYIGDKLSLYVYLFHILVASVLSSIIMQCILKLDTNNSLFLWLNPIIVAILSIIVSHLIVVVTKNIKSRKKFLTKL